MTDTPDRLFPAEIELEIPLGPIDPQILTTMNQVLSTRAHILAMDCANVEELVEKLNAEARKFVSEMYANPDHYQVRLNKIGNEVHGARLERISAVDLLGDLGEQPC